MSDTILAWHFVGQTLLDGRPIPADGAVLTQDGEIVPCRNGLHASERLIDALQYALDETLCRVECSGTVVHEENKLAASRRVILWRIDAADVLRSFARRCALDAAHLWDIPDIVRQYLETGDPALQDTAGAAARHALKVVTTAAPRFAACASWAATESDANAVTCARAAACFALDAATWAGSVATNSPSGADILAAQNERLTTMVMERRAEV